MVLSELPENPAAPGFLVIEGPIGVGKTSLVKRLAEHFGGETLLEGAEENPFLQRFYDNPRESAFPAQLYFLFQRSRQMSELQQGDMFRQRLIADFMLEKDRLFAQINLDRDELDLYEQVYERLTLQAPPPDLVVYLQAPVDVLMERIRRRARIQERRMDIRWKTRPTSGCWSITSANRVPSAAISTRCRCCSDRAVIDHRADSRHANIAHHFHLLIGSI
jgi:deoxyguanosine kinase